MNRMMWKMVACVSACFLAASVAPVVGAETDGAGVVSLRPQWQTGQRARYGFWTERRQDISVRFDGNTRETGSTIVTEGELEWEIERVRPDGGAEALMTLDWMTAESRPDEGPPQTHDSRVSGGALPALQSLLEAMAGRPIRVTLRPDGSVASVDGVDAMRDAAEVAELVPEELDFVESATDLATLAFAPAEAEVGDTWSADFRWTHELGHVDQSWEFELAGIESVAGVSVAMVEGKADLTLDTDTLRERAPADAPPTEVELETDEARQTIMFDLTRGEAVGRDMSFATTVHVTMSLPNNRRLAQTTREVERSQVWRLSEAGGE